MSTMTMIVVGLNAAAVLANVAVLLFLPVSRDKAKLHVGLVMLNSLMILWALGALSW